MSSPTPTVIIMTPSSRSSSAMSDGLFAPGALVCLPSVTKITKLVASFLSFFPVNTFCLTTSRALSNLVAGDVSLLISFTFFSNSFVLNVSPSLTSTAADLPKVTTETCTPSSLRPVFSTTFLTNCFSAVISLTSFVETSTRKVISKVMFLHISLVFLQVLSTVSLISLESISSLAVSAVSINSGFDAMFSSKSSLGFSPITMGTTCT